MDDIAFSEIQKKYLKIKKSKYHETNGKQNNNSILNYNPQKNFNEIILLYNIFIDNLKSMIDSKSFDGGYCGKEFLKKQIRDSKEEIDFNKFFIPYAELEYIVYNTGCYLPMVVFKTEEKYNIMECLHSRYPSTMLQILFSENKIDNRSIFYIEKSFIKKNSECNLKIPKQLYDEVIINLELEVIETQSNFLTIKTKDNMDAWLIFKLIHKEVSWVTGKYGFELYNMGMKPSNFINIEENN